MIHYLPRTELPLQCQLSVISLSNPFSVFSLCSGTQALKLRTHCFEAFTRHLISANEGKPHLLFTPMAGYHSTLREVLTLPGSEFNKGRNYNGDTLADHMMVREFSSVLYLVGILFVRPLCIQF